MVFDVHAVYNDLFWCGGCDGWRACFDLLRVE
jgi:hypothetical protein